ncbi:glucose-6-phosphate dehydrogenase [Shewanella sp. D64]|uniref:glucose-6-phosphate dehydrogenase n=1 Tax=unclassified Shewanella TaxID=196818 RepID=UPI0022BA604E|nr:MULTISPECIES: glucose-6-phosphate dehydrogenase [unclassified Shewanella]MEC4725243.1 glucose-6-phosphate dehydrogenase [Shewanella sp. D64]MEC4735911.1 glucose-6-phosphate dehydrogenase [Shewanella sp. E94]WBJ93121.1 glucose-6-phosphate dehydrogenase [Shewanella sp. MTB7]
MGITTPEAKACDFVLFGTKGDLARRKLLPSLYQLDKAGLLNIDTKIIGVAKDAFTHEEFNELVIKALLEFVKEELCEETLARFLTRCHYIGTNFTDSEGYQAFHELLEPSKRVMVSYFATPPSIFGDICRCLHDQNLIQSDSRVVLEKPIGSDLKSSKVINDQVAAFYNEDQVYRIDHYLGKETVQNLIALRFANSLFASKWDNRTIDHVQISVSEEVGIEGRWGYFDKAGQMRDMIQNHLLQVLTLVAMDPPVNLDADSIRDEKVKVLKSLRPINLDNIYENTVRGQYTSGFLKGSPVPGYLEEEGANTQSNAETFVALRVDIDNWRWAGVPFYLRSGKRMPTKSSEIVVYFKNPPHNLYRSNYRTLPPNKLTIRLQPHEGVEIQMMNKVPGLEQKQRLQTTKLDLSFTETFKNERIADAYERLLLEAMLGNQALFVRRDEVEQAWTWVDGIIQSWEESNEKPKPYPAGSWGPVASVALIAKDGRSWDE